MKNELIGRSGAFSDNMSLPIHRWFRYSAGFSADWVRWLITEKRKQKKQITVLDPFCGVGTTLLASDAENVKSYGFETHPFVNRIANVKVSSIQADIKILESVLSAFLKEIKLKPLRKLNEVSPLLSNCYSQENLSTLITMRDYFLEKYDKKTIETELLWLAITAILRSCSQAGTAQWQYILPNKSKASVQSPITALNSKMNEIISDIQYAQSNNWFSSSSLILTDARMPENCSEIKADLVITSPPYPNNYDYADATRLEMTFWGEIKGWGDLQASVRKYLIRSCSQHSAAEKLKLDELLSEEILIPIHDELSVACEKLAKVRETKGGRKTYHTMAAAYFRDLGLVFKSLMKLCKNGSELCFVIGDSAPYGIYLNVDEWLGRLALEVGFKSYFFEKIRDRNIKWKNRKHRVPLKEGRLWIKG